MNENLELKYLYMYPLHVSEKLHIIIQGKKVRDVMEGIQPGRMFFIHEQK